MPIVNPKADFVNLVASEITAGIDRAVEHWLARIEQELGNTGMTTIDRMRAVECVLHEYKKVTGKANLICAPA
jgi:hypothetical protein